MLISRLQRGGVLWHPAMDPFRPNCLSRGCLQPSPRSRSAPSTMKTKQRDLSLSELGPSVGHPTMDPFRPNCLLGGCHARPPPCCADFTAPAAGQIPPHNGAVQAELSHSNFTTPTGGRRSSTPQRSRSGRTVWRRCRYPQQFPCVDGVKQPQATSRLIL